ncbi:MAG TPA: triose-phosphate isomerase, partial [Gemmatimonadales bacterium]|nr:triose-phosphate isomerase [Gemmatimonadales bacterium]
ELVPPRVGRELWFYPPAPALPAVADAIARREDARVGAQNVHWEANGAFTGEVSVPIVAEAGARGALVGHSERRHIFGEADEDTRRKVAALHGGRLTPMLCVGETLEERESERTEAVVLRQLRAGLDGLTVPELEATMIAYEPVWAIGTGRNATPADAAAVHRVIRAELARLGAVERVPVLYGGSVNLRNALSLLAEDEIDGVLVGGASLEPDGWAELVGIG